MGCPCHNQKSLTYGGHLSLAVVAAFLVAISLLTLVLLARGYKIRN